MRHDLQDSARRIRIPVSTTDLTVPDPPLRDEVVALRPWREEDLPEHLLAFGDPLVLRFSWPFVDPYTEADARAYLAEQRLAWRRGTGAEFACVEPGDERALLGGASVYDIEIEQRRAAIGYWLTAPARGRGVATHAVALLVGWAFGQVGLERLQITCGPDNVASQRVAERCGFAREGVLRSHMRFKGGRRDTVVFGRVVTNLRQRT